MLGRLILLFILLPLADLWLLLVLSNKTSWQFSVLLRGEFSTELLSDGAMIFFAAGLLLTPGFITDAIGLSVLIPPIRNWYKKLMAKWFKVKTNFEIVMPQMGHPDQQAPLDENTVEGKVADSD